MRRVLLFVLLIAVVGCSAGTDTPEEIDITGNWQLASGSVDGEDIPVRADSPATLNVVGTEISGTSSCNQYGGQFILDGSEISIGDLYSTMMMCTPEVMAVEIPYTAALSEVDTVVMDGDELVMTGPGIELRFASGDTR